jgi:hypothetical protein
MGNRGRIGSSKFSGREDQRLSSQPHDPTENPRFLQKDPKQKVLSEVEK